MKTARFLFTIAGFGALTLGLTFAGEPSRQPSGPAASENHTASDCPADPVKRTSANDLHQPGLNKAATPAKDGLIMNKTGNPREQLARLPLGTRPATPLPGVVRGRVAATASIGGLAASSAKTSAAVINGTGMKPKP
jgi:hypothetical protein